MSLLFLDTETSGLPICKSRFVYHHPSKTEYYNSARLLQLACVAYHDQTEIDSLNVIIKATDFDISSASTLIHSIDTAKSLEQGIDCREALNKLYKILLKTTTIVGHNVEFDINILLSECYRHDYKELIELINSREVQCSMIMAKAYLTRPYPKLIDLYNHLFETKREQIHDALDDVRICIDCYFYMINNPLAEVKEVIVPANDDTVITFGKHKGLTFIELIKTQRNYCAYVRRTFRVSSNPNAKALYNYVNSKWSEI